MEQAFEVGIIQRTNIPRLRFPNFNSSWENIKLGNIAKIIMGQSPIGDSYNFKGEGVPLINGPGEFTEKYPVKIKWTDKPIRFCEKSDILFCVRGSSTGRVNIANDSYCIGRGIAAIRANQYSNLNFLEYSVERNLKDLLVFAVGSTFINLDNKSLSEFRVYTPSLPEQTKIGSFISTVDEKLQALKKKKRLLEEFKKGIMQKLFSQELRFKDENGKEFPEWEAVLGSAVFDSISKKGNIKLPILAVTQEHGAIPRNLIDYQISVTDKSIESYKEVNAGDFIISLRSFQGGIEYSKYTGICSPAYIVLRPKIKLNDLFFKYYFKSPPYIKLLNSKLEGIRDGKMVSFKYFSEIKLPLPSIREQSLISEFIFSIDCKIRITEELINNEETWKKGLLQKMFC